MPARLHSVAKPRGFEGQNSPMVCLRVTVSAIILVLLGFINFLLFYKKIFIFVYFFLIKRLKYFTLLKEPPPKVLKNPSHENFLAVTDCTCVLGNCFLYNYLRESSSRLSNLTSSKGMICCLLYFFLLIIMFP